MVKAMHVVTDEGHIWPWKLKVKVMVKIKTIGQIWGPGFNQ